MERLATVTGGAGFLGSHVAGRLLEDGWSVRVLDTVASEERPRSPDVEYLEGDIRDHQAVERSVRGAAAVVHAAFASPNAGRSAIFDVNVAGTRAVAAAASRAGVGRIVAVSSTIVERPPRSHPLAQSTPIARLEAYRLARIAAEDELRLVPADGPAVAVARPKTFVGPGRVGGFALVFDLVRTGAAVPLLGRGDARYQVVDVRDLTDGLARLVDSPASGVFHFGATVFGTVAHDLSAVIDHAGTASRLRRVPAGLGRIALRGAELAGLPPLAEWHHCVAAGVDSVVDTHRARVELGWEPARSNAEALIGAYDWFADRAAHGQVDTTHPIPLTHRLGRRLAGAVLR